MLKLERIQKELKRNKKNLNIQEMERIKILSLVQINNNLEEMSKLTENKGKKEPMKKLLNSLKPERNKYIR